MGLRLSYYPSRLTREELNDLAPIALHAISFAGEFGYWLTTTLQNESVRRLARQPVEPFLLPIDWSDEQLGKAIQAATFIDRTVESHGAQRFMDSIMDGLNAVTCARLGAAA
jgi:hypothetical protein